VKQSDQSISKPERGQLLEIYYQGRVIPLPVKIITGNWQPLILASEAADAMALAGIFTPSPHTSSRSEPICAPQSVFMPSSALFELNSI
jgi:hypothetical protein